jgi:hypothetical protein
MVNEALLFGKQQPANPNVPDAATVAAGPPITRRFRPIQAKFCWRIQLFGRD